MYYRDHNGQLCYDDDQQDWFVDEDTAEIRLADWFWYLDM